MDFRLSDEQVEWQRKCHAFARDVMRPAADHYDRTQETPWDIIKAASEQGLYGLDYIQAMGSDTGGLFGVIYAAYQFAIPYIMLGSNPGPDADLMMTLIYRQSFSNNLFGFGAAASTLLMLAMGVWVLFWYRLFKRDLEVK